MKRRDLIRTIGKAAGEVDLDWRLLREGASHSIYTLDGLRVPIPRHTEINERTAAGILRTCAEKLGEDWWQE